MNDNIELLIAALKENNNVLNHTLMDPLVPKDNKALIKDRISLNNGCIALVRLKQEVES